MFLAKITRPKRTSQEVMEQVAVQATQHAIPNGNGSGAGGHGGGAHNADTHTDERKTKAEEPGDNYIGEVPRDVCLGEAIDRHCMNKLCWRKHGAKSIEQFKAALGTKRWEKQKQW